jgi:hypothetical protein
VIHISRFLNPRGFMRNVALGQPVLDRVGDFQRLSPNQADRDSGNTDQPDVFYLQAQLGAQQAHDELQAFVNQELENLDIPAQMVRTTDSSTVLSGVAIIAKQVPFYSSARDRQPLATQTEIELFAVSCAVAGVFYGDAQLVAAANSPDAQIDWPEPKVPLPTTERDIADQWELDQGLTDQIAVYARRHGCTLAQAEEALEQVAERRKQFNEMMAGTLPEPGSGAPGAPVAPIVDPNDPGAEPGEDEQPDSENES